MTTSLKHRDLWEGEYRGVRVEIIRWDWDMGSITPRGMMVEEDWNAYAWLRGEPTKEKLESLPWYGGLTFNHSVGGTTKAGCDYCHAFDVGKTYSVEEVEKDLMEVIDAYLNGIEAPPALEQDKDPEVGDEGG